MFKFVPARQRKSLCCSRDDDGVYGDRAGAPIDDPAGELPWTNGGQIARHRRAALAFAPLQRVGRT